MAQIELDETVMEDVITSRGLRTLHIMRRGQPVNPFAWAQKWIDAKVPEECQSKDLLQWHVTREGDPALDYWHLTLYWNAREMIEFGRGWQDAALRYGVLWYIAPGESVTPAAKTAATLYVIHTGRIATGLWLRHEPAHKPTRVETDYGPLQVVTGQDWVPERYLVVGVPRNDWDAKFVGGRYE